jgi:hypothetical protein
MKVIDEFVYRGKTARLYEATDEPEAETHIRHHYRAFIGELEVTEKVLHPGELPKWGHYAKRLIDEAE